MGKLNYKELIRVGDLSGKIRQGSKVSFKWHGSDSLYTGRIEMRHDEPYFVNEFNYKSAPHILEVMKYYNPLDGFAFFTEFNVLEY